MKINKRSENWAPDEKKLLLESITKFKDVIECKSNDGKALKRKRDAWKEIAETFKCRGFFRDAEGIRGQWKRMKYAARKTLCQFELDNVKTEENLPLPEMKVPKINYHTDSLENFPHKLLKCNKTDRQQGTNFRTATIDPVIGQNLEIERLSAENEERRKEEIHLEVMKQLAIDKQRKQIELETAKLLFEKVQLELKKMKDDLENN